MQLGILNKLDQDMSNSRNSNNAQSSLNEDPQENNDVNYTQNFSNDHKKEYKVSTLDWLGGQARI
tara:strand:+ start:7461 stop:7655 length:195 start_codon:yes stop_codon:yes gene_type:complete